MKINKSFIFLAALTSLALASCNANGSSKSSSLSPSQPPAEDNRVNVFVLSGQSNMEGSTYWTHPTNNTPLLENYFEEENMDFSTVRDGIPNVLTSYYGFYYPHDRDGTPAWTHAHTASTDTSTPEARLTPNFKPTKVGMGVADKGDNPNPFFGPELGLAYQIAEYVDEDHPVYLIKCAFSGSGFTKTDGPNWESREDDPTKSLFYLLKTYTHNCLEAIENEGFEPVIKGFVWHQGESGGGNPDYETSMRALLHDFKEEFEDYAPDQDTDYMAFLDCTIYDGNSPVSYKNSKGEVETNIAKRAIADESEDDLNFCINANHEEGGLGLDIGNDAQGGYNTYHYNTKDAFILGQAYGDLIIDNDLLDF